MTTLLVQTISTKDISTQYYHTREEAVKAGKWYLSLKENGHYKYAVKISKKENK